MSKKKVYILLPSDKDGGGNRWSYLLANNLSLDENFDINLYVCKTKNEKQNIYPLHKRVVKKSFNFNLPRIFALYLFTKKTISSISDDSIILVSDPILSILLSIFSRGKTKVIRNIAADDYNLYNYSRIYKYSGLIFIYRLFLHISFYNKNITNIFNSEYTYIKNYKNHKFAFISNDISKRIIHPMMSNIYFEKKKLNKNLKKNIVVLPRKHTTKGFSLIENLYKSNILDELGIENIYLVFNENINIKPNKYFKIINPKSDNEIIEIFDKSYCFISTSSNEGFGLPPLEALSRNCIPIIGEAGGNATFSQNLFNCLTYDTQKDNHLANILKKLYANDELAVFLKKNFNSTLAPHSEKHISNKWKSLIIDLVSNGKKKNTNLFSLYYYYRESFLKRFRSVDNVLFKKLTLELILFPILILKNYLIIFTKKNNISNNSQKKVLRKHPTLNIKLCIQDWVCYENTRFKTLKNGASYKCGLEGQDMKFFSKKYSIQKNLFISGTKNEHELFFDNKIKNLKFENFVIQKTNNDLLDFSSYKLFYESLDKDINETLIFCNSSVSTEFNFPIIDQYLDFFYENKDVGLMGISSNTKDQQSFIFNNFNPHIQTLFFITTTFILRDIISKNRNLFPGEDATPFNKYSIIQHGELLLSKLILKLGYSLAIVNQFGEVLKFNQINQNVNFNKWTLPKSDMRTSSMYPSQAKILK